MKSKRKDAREIAADLLKIRWEDSEGVMHKGVANLEDISRGGVCLQTDRPISPGTVVTILYPNGTYRGEVKYCFYKDSSFFIGVEFDPGFRWSTRLYTPAHRLKVEDD